MNYKTIKKLFFKNQADLWSYLDRNELEYLSRQFFYTLRAEKLFTRQEITQEILMGFMLNVIEQSELKIKEITEYSETFRDNIAKVKNIREESKLIRNVLKQAGFGQRVLLKRKKWLDRESVYELFNHKILSLKKRISAIYHCLIPILKNIDGSLSDLVVTKSFIDTAFVKLQSENIHQIRLGLLNLLKSVLSEGKDDLNDFIFNEGHTKHLLALYSEIQTTTWEKCAIIDILAMLQYPNLRQFLREEISPEKQNDIFVRKHSVQAIIILLRPDKEDACVLNSILADPSPFVRQGLAESLPELPKNIIPEYFELVLLKDKETSVKCSAVNIAETILHKYRIFDPVFTSLNIALKTSEDNRLIRFILEILPSYLRALKGLEPALFEKHVKVIAETIEGLHVGSDEILIRRKAALCREKLWSISLDSVFNFISSTETKLKKIKPGKSLILSNDEIKDFDDYTLGRILACLSQNDYSIQYVKTIFGRNRLIRNAGMDFRWWRFFHEFKTPSPDKRQTFKHSLGRHFAGTLRSSSSIMSEVSETKVPGEPLFIPEEGNARPYLPLVDELISSSESNDKISIFTSEGITSLQAQKNPFKRFFTELKLTSGFSGYARLRNWNADLQVPPCEYISRIRKLGFKIEITPHKNDQFFSPKLDPKVKQFFAAAPILPISIYNVLIELKIYFFALYQNTIYQLSAFIACMATIFIGRHIYLSQSLKKSRKSIPLVIGGWGTRGKSGTERLKAALFSSLGASVFSKTTGCEAMFLYSPPFASMTEFILFRPYDKATIWEQYNVVKLASKLKTDVFLWECMALSPSYVKILQKNWMRDDFSTITNTFPDHEDIQGPAGWNVADTMRNFIPDKGHLITTEEQMFPILETESFYRDTEFYRISWKDTMLITPDIVSRFPYEEHPYNIALVAKLAEELGILKDFALKEMADNIMPDIGVLKQYPEAEVASRKLIFFSGMSANERYACMQNWYRMNFDRYNPDTEPEIYITTVVNNRADRIARSKVFADILVDDLSADKHFLIGNNLKGLKGYIKNSFDEKYKDFSLWHKTEGKHADPEATFIKIATFFRIPTNEGHLKKRLSIMISTIGNIDHADISKHWQDLDKLKGILSKAKHEYSEQICDFHRSNLAAYNEFKNFLNSIPSSENVSVNEKCRSLLWKWFQAKLVIVENYYAKGNEIIEIISAATPPGFTNKIMALQNIKGTGLDFFYRWQDWERCFSICDSVILKDDTIDEVSLKQLAAYPYFEILAVSRIEKLINALETNKNSDKTIQLLAEEIKNKLTIKVPTGKTKSTIKEPFIKETLINLTEDLLDPRFSVIRRKKADKVYKNLARGTISYAKAKAILLQVTTQQKGGWLKRG